MTGRELAWRVLANELQASDAEERGAGEKIPSYVISPLGARMNRVLVAGTIAPTERVGVDSNTGFVRARLTDPTGVVLVTAGSYQPQGQADLERIRDPTRVLVVGKLSRVRGGLANSPTSLRAETVQPVSEAEYSMLLAEAATQTLDRLDLVLRLRSKEPPTDAELGGAGVSPYWIRGARSAIERYPSLDPAPYYESLRAVLVSLRAAPAPDERRPTARPPPVTVPEVVRMVHPRAPPPARSLPAGLGSLEGRLLEILDDLAEHSPDGYADMDELSERAACHGLEGERMEELLNYLSENGTLEEPLVGKFRRAEGPPRE
jgi:uncharacterized protein